MKAEINRKQNAAISKADKLMTRLTETKRESRYSYVILMERDYNYKKARSKKIRKYLKLHANFEKSCESLHCNIYNIYYQNRLKN